MDISVDKPNVYTRIVDVNVPGKDISLRVEEKLKELIPTLNVPGFRRGKTPVSVVRLKYGEYILKDLDKELFDEASTEAYNKIKDDKPLEMVKMEHPEISESNGYKLRMEFIVKPLVELKKYKELSLKRIVLEPTEKDIDNAINDLREQNAYLEEVYRPAALGDFVVAEITPDGEEAPVIRYLPLTENIPTETSNRLLGVREGDEVIGTLSFPDNYLERNLAGKSISGRYKIIAVKGKVLPAVDEEFIQSVSPELHTEKELKEWVKNSLEKQGNDYSKAILEKEAKEALLRENPVEIPEPLVKKIAVRNFATRIGLDPEKIPDEQIDVIVKEMGANTRMDIGAAWLLEEIVSREGLKASDEEVDEYVENEAKRLKTNKESLLKSYEENGYIESLRSDIALKKALTLVIESAHIEEVRKNKEGKQ